MASGVDSVTAYVFWRAVHHFGPRWSNPSCDPAAGNCQLSATTGKPILQTPKITPASLQAFQRDIQHIKDERLRQSVADLVNNYIVN